MEARVAFSGDQTSWFFLREAVGHVYVVGFVRRSLDCTNTRLMSRVCLSLWILDTALSYGGYEMLWSLNPADKHV